MSTGTSAATLHTVKPHTTEGDGAASHMQLLRKVQIPSAMPSILAGVNQTIMMALSMVIIASMVGAGGLGNDVLASIQRLDIGLGFESGMAVVLLAIILDRITESFGTKQTARGGIFAWFSGKLQRQ